MDDRLLAGRQILVVEDEMLVLMAIEDMLADLGCTAVCVAANIGQALDLIATRTFDLATLDVNLNGQRSYPVASALRQRGVPFAFSTGYGELGVGEGFAGCPVISKPFTAGQLVSVLSLLLLGPAQSAGLAA